MFWKFGKKEQKKFISLHEAANDGDVSAIKCLIREGTNVRQLDGNGVPPLQYAAHRGYLEITRLLVDHGADVNFVIEGGGTPLMGAARGVQPRVIELLLSKGAQPNIKGEEGSPLACCCHQPHPDRVKAQLECIQLLIKAGAKVNETTDSGSTALMKAGWFGNREAAEELLRLGADPTMRDEHDRTAAMLAFERGHLELAKLLKQAADEWPGKSGRK